MRPRRLEKIAGALKREISMVIMRELKDPRINLVTVTKTEPAEDLRSAKVYVSVIGSETKKKRTLRALNRARGYIQSQISKRLEIRYTPMLKFNLDDSVTKGVRLSKLIDEIAEGEDTE